MATSAVSFGALVTLEELNPSSPHFKQGASLRVSGKLQEYDLETAIASISEGNASLKIDTQHLKVNLRIGSLYQFIGELLIDTNNELIDCAQICFITCSIYVVEVPQMAILRARVGRNVDGMDLNLYRQSLQLLRDFQAEQIDSRTA